MAAFSTGIGEAGILFINRASKLQFVRGLVGSALVLASAALIWSSCIWVSSRVALGWALHFRHILGLVLVSYTPFVFAFLVIIPHLGLLFHRVFLIWGLLITIAGLNIQFGLTLWQGIACSGFGWLIFYLLTYIFGVPAEKIRLSLLGRKNWVKPKAAAVALLEREMGV